MQKYSRQPAKTPGTAASGRPARRRLPPAERRAQIIRAAKELFGEGGIEHVSMRNIARRVGITQAAIYQHFEDKAAILFAVAEDFFNELIVAMQAAIAGENDPIEQFKRTMRSYVETGLARPEVYRLIFMTDISGLVRTAHRVPPGQEDQLRPSKGTVAFGMLHERIQALMASGHIRKDDPDAVAEALWAAGHGIVSLLITHAKFPWVPREKMLTTQMRMLLEGLLPDNRRKTAV